jgi:hypothetical protein
MITRHDSMFFRFNIIMPVESSSKQRSRDEVKRGTSLSGLLYFIYVAHQLYREYTFDKSIEPIVQTEFLNWQNLAQRVYFVDFHLRYVTIYKEYTIKSLKIFIHIIHFF